MTFCFVLIMLVAIYQGTVALCACAHEPDAKAPGLVGHAVGASIICAVILFLISSCGLLAVWKP